MSQFIPHAIRLLSALPLWSLYALAWCLYVLLFHVFRVRRRLTLQNLGASFVGHSESECLQVAKDHYKNVCMVIAEIIKAAGLNGQRLKQRVTFRNSEILERYLADHRSVVVVTAHHCNPEWALLAGAQHFGYPIDLIYRTQRSAWLEKFFYELRTDFGVTPLAMHDCIKASMKRAKIARIIVMAADQSPHKEDAPHWQMFLNRETAFHTGAEKITRAFKYPLIFMSMQRRRKGYYEAVFKLLAEPPYSKKQVNQCTQRYVKELEALIEASPADWLWAYRRWKIEKPVYG